MAKVEVSSSEHRYGYTCISRICVGERCVSQIQTAPQVTLEGIVRWAILTKTQGLKGICFVLHFFSSSFWLQKVNGGTVSHHTSEI